MTKLTRRSVLATGAAGAAATLMAGTAFAQDRKRLRLSSVVSNNDIRAKAFARISEDVAKDFDLQVYNQSTLVPQGGELTSIQRGTLEMGLVAPQKLADQVPEWSILTAAYVLRDAAHMKAVFDSDVGKQLNDLAAQAGLHVLAPVYFGARQVNLKPEKKINTPEDLKGMTLRMPGGDAWQFLGEAIGASPTPLAYSEVYTALQTGAIDGQDNPLPNDYNMKFYEVTSQIALTSHLVGFDVLGISKKVWDDMSADQQKLLKDSVDKEIAASTEEHLKREQELVDFFKEQGLEVYEPDRAAFRDYAQKKYLASDFAKSWPEGMLEQINAIQA
ncbi:C4-dicarboxylate ABC transporter [Thioclava sediminum]|uniref:TRAP transporter substrate-binding protein DctP n=2 Tax=Thioclava TaxID=285107 RepID=A0ABX6YWX8_9RHOB|nr:MULTISPECIES: TRAP transporter substrate-binding protein DctP [Thioclava]OOY03240.1 C4-dicarboxylate ABC transporter [Thioclava sp. F28-4]OOY18777.1 C4-dicarboxylate ABC transporter [Thioclava sp. DLFJ5-1]OOY22625.1 C4-dicarboxylate ABC transporter [Thioclava sediminum]OOY31021.1 C4-dicarboxylate ABC transporter [Thioclava sp. F36-6]QPZ91708.1 TRAP transporter substrate-binding protein DctP [Thioclava electrotropha]